MRNVLTKLFIAGFATTALVAAVSTNARPIKAQSLPCHPYFSGGWCRVVCEWHDVRWCPEFLCPSRWVCEDHYSATGVEPPEPEPCDATCTDE